MMQEFIADLTRHINESEPSRALKEFLNVSRENTLALHGIEGFPLAVLLGNIRKSLTVPLTVIMVSEDEARHLASDLKLLQVPSVYLPANGQSLHAFYDGSYYTDADQISSIYRIRRGGAQVIITTLRAFILPVMGLASLSREPLQISCNTAYSLDALAQQLASFGYLRVPKTSVHGEFTLRGEVLDIFPPDAGEPYRIVFSWDTVESVRPFDPISQVSNGERLKQLTLLPIAADEDDTFGHAADILDPESRVLLKGKESLRHGWLSLQQECRDAYRSAYSRFSHAMRTEEVLFDYPAWTQALRKTITLEEIRQDAGARHALSFGMQSARSYFGNITYCKEEFSSLLDAGYSIYLFCGSGSQLERLSFLFREFSLEFVEEDISSGFSFPDAKLMAVTENELFGRKKRHRNTLANVKSSPLDTFVELNPGDYIVHLEYGVGKFIQIERIRAAGKERDYILIEYADKERVFIPIEQVNLLQKYIGHETSPPRLDSLGSGSWENKKKRVKKSVEDLAEKLIALYAQRERQRGVPFPKDTDWQVEFEAAFPFEETEDQLACISDVKTDMEKGEPMDRLICGDVGFGKTEVALRAIFKAVTSGRQAAFLAPTTILAEQHYRTLLERNRNFPINVALLSRLVDARDQRRIVKDLEEGRADVLVGTHRMLQKDVRFKDLGLLVIDEEQRFGVKDKERIKELKVSVDCLSLSATPIPRTLYMSLLKIRNMSLLTTPPLQRLPIETIINEFDDKLLVEAVLREVERGGQVFYLHNRVRTLQKTVTLLQRMMPQVSITYAHGRMASHTLEDRMRAFIGGSYQVLVSTTIIENGIDIPNVNTIIIDRADNYGVSQLYQLRGRVGRSDQKAYAYLFYPPDRALSEVAMKRLKVISDHTELGSGFRIAMRDMEIRGTGNLLGREQHGHMATVGLDMYLRMLDEAVAAMSEKQQTEPVPEVLLDLDYSGFIPDSYIQDASTKFEVYKRVASIRTPYELESVTANLENTYGPVPDEVANLLYIAELKIICRKLSVSSLRERQGKVRVEFFRVANISVKRVMELIGESGGSVRLDPRHPHVLLMSTEAISLKDKSLFILEKLQRLVP